jgi:hypothetical protein
MPLQRLSALHDVASLCWPQGSPAGAGHQSSGDTPHGFFGFFAAAPLQPMVSAKARASIVLMARSYPLAGARGQRQAASAR